MRRKAMKARIAFSAAIAAFLLLLAQAAPAMDIVQILKDKVTENDTVKCWWQPYQQNFSMVRPVSGEVVEIHLTVSEDIPRPTLTCVDKSIPASGMWIYTEAGPGFEELIDGTDYFFFTVNGWSSREPADIYGFWITPDGKIIDLLGNSYDNLNEVKPIISNWKPEQQHVTFRTAIGIPYTVDGSYYLFIGARPHKIAGHFHMDGWKSFHLRGMYIRKPQLDHPVYQELANRFNSMQDAALWINSLKEASSIARGLPPDVNGFDYAIWTGEHRTPTYFPYDDQTKWLQFAWNCDTVADFFMGLAMINRKKWGIKHAWYVSFRECKAGGHSVLIFQTEDDRFNICDKDGSCRSSETFAGIIKAEQLYDYMVLSDCRQLHIYRDWTFRPISGELPPLNWREIFNKQNYVTTKEFFGVPYWAVVDLNWALEHLKSADDVNRLLETGRF